MSVPVHPGVGVHVITVLPTVRGKQYTSITLYKNITMINDYALLTRTESLESQDL